MGEWAEGYVRSAIEARQAEALDELRALAGSSDLAGRAKEVTEGWKTAAAKVAERESTALVESARRHLAA
jgi:hypothetical protein